MVAKTATPRPIQYDKISKNMLIIVAMQSGLFVSTFLHGFFFEKLSRIATHIATWITAVEYVFLEISMWLR